MTRLLSSGLRLGLTTVCLALAGCSVLFIPNPSDLQLIGVERVDLRRRPESDLRSFRDDPEPRHALLIRFSTRTDLARFSLRHEPIIDPTAAFCAAPVSDPQQILFTRWGVYDAIDNVQWRHEHPTSGPPDAAGRHTYHAFLMIRRGGIRQKSETVPLRIAYDLEQDPRDVCFWLQGGNILGADFTTNTIVIPAAAIRAALDHAATP